MFDQRKKRLPASDSLANFFFRSWEEKIREAYERGD